MLMPGTLAAIDSSLMMLLGAICLVLLAVSVLRRAQQRPATTRDLTREQLARLRDQREIRDSLDEILVQLEEVSRRVNAQLDTKFVRLETAIRDADQRIARLHALLHRAGDAADTGRPARPPGPDARAAGPPPAVGSPPEFEPALGAAAESRADPGTTGRPPSPAAADRPEAAADNADGGAAAARPPRFQRIYELADAGNPPIAIADALHMPLGEVELILGLRNYR